MAFWELKSLITSAPVLILPNQDAPFQLKTNASSYMTGVILSQLCDDEKWHPVSFTSKSLSPTKRNYTNYDKELLLVIHGLEEWRLLKSVPGRLTQLCSLVGVKQLSYYLYQAD